MKKKENTHIFASLVLLYAIVSLNVVISISTITLVGWVFSEQGFITQEESQHLISVVDKMHIITWVLLIVGVLALVLGEVVLLRKKGVKKNEERRF
jgi:magnesium-transporting ATPase (P-type)